MLTAATNETHLYLKFLTQIAERRPVSPEERAKLEPTAVPMAYPSTSEVDIPRRMLNAWELDFLAKHVKDNWLVDEAGNRITLVLMNSSDEAAWSTFRDYLAGAYDARENLAGYDEKYAAMMKAARAQGYID